MSAHLKAYRVYIHMMETFKLYVEATDEEQAKKSAKSDFFEMSVTDRRMSLDCDPVETFDIEEVGQ